MTVPSVRMQGWSGPASILASPFSIGDGPKTTVADCGVQSGVVVTAPAVFWTVYPPSFLTVT